MSLNHDLDVANPRRGDSGFWGFWVLTRQVAVGWLLLLSTALAQVQEAPLSQRLALTPLAALSTVALTVAEGDRLQTEAGSDPFTPLRFASPIAVALTPQSHGQWQRLPDGRRVWRLRLSVAGATSLNVGFTTFHLPNGVSLYLLGEAEGDYQGPYTAADNAPHYQLWTPVVAGDRAIVELNVAADVELEAIDLLLSQVNAGFIDLGSARQALSYTKQGQCNIDTVCPEGDLWRDEIRSVALLSINGRYFCTGTLVMDAVSSFRPYILTAHHCGIDRFNAATVVAYWNYESPTCGRLGGGSRQYSQTGATWLAGRADVDMSLIELDEVPDADFNVYYSGWSRSATAPSGSVTIHHPNADEKAISLNSDPLTSGFNCAPLQESITPNTHWYMNWEQGTTEPGSSGAGLWNSSGYLIGFLTGGAASCSFPKESDCYGKFSVAWEGSSASTRLRDWLDPEDSGVVTVAGSDPISAEPPPAPPSPFPPSPRCDEAVALISASDSLAGEIEPAGSAQMYRFELASSGTVTLTTTGSVDTFGTLLDGQCRVIDESDDEGAGFNLLLQPELPPGTYYLQVRGYSAETSGSYGLEISLPAIPNTIFASQVLFVLQVYRDILQREGDVNGVSYWTTVLNQLGDYSGRIEVIAYFLSSQEFLAEQNKRFPGLSQEEATVTALYVGMLGREPDPPGLAFWADAFRRGVPYQELIALFYESPEYLQRFLP